MKRMIELDVLRGFLLLMMVANHSPSPLRQITDQPIGFFLQQRRSFLSPLFWLG